MHIESLLEDNLRKIIAKMDVNGDGYIQYSEFMTAAEQVCMMISDLYLKQAFDLFDFGDGETQGLIHVDTLKNIMCGAIETKRKM